MPLNSTKLALQMVARNPDQQQPLAGRLTATQAFTLTAGTRRLPRILVVGASAPDPAVLHACADDRQATTGIQRTVSAMNRTSLIEPLRGRAVS